jgi:hypothetical protein
MEGKYIVNHANKQAFKCDAGASGLSTYEVAARLKWLPADCEVKFNWDAFRRQQYLLQQQQECHHKPWQVIVDLPRNGGHNLPNFLPNLLPNFLPNLPAARHKRKFDEMDAS